MQILATNTTSGAISTYEDYPFSSFCEVDGAYYGAGPAGVALLDVGRVDITDVGEAPISSGVGTGGINVGDIHSKSIAGVVVDLGRSSGAVTVTITADEEASYAPVVLEMEATGVLGPRRLIMPRGVRGTSWRFEVNAPAGYFEFVGLGANIFISQNRV